MESSRHANSCLVGAISELAEADEGSIPMFGAVIFLLLIIRPLAAVPFI